MVRLDEAALLTPHGHCAVSQAGYEDTSVEFDQARSHVVNETTPFEP